MFGRVFPEILGVRMQKNRQTHTQTDRLIAVLLSNCRNKKFSICWDSVTCKPLDAVEIQNCIFFRTPGSQYITIWVSFGMQIHRRMLSCTNFYFYWHFRQTDGRYARSISETCDSFIHSFIHQGRRLAVGSLSTCLSAYHQRWGLDMAQCAIPL